MSFFNFSALHLFRQRRDTERRAQRLRWQWYLNHPNPTRASTLSLSENAPMRSIADEGLVLVRRGEVLQFLPRSKISHAG